MIHNGYDPQDFDAWEQEPKKISIAHFGTYPQSRNHRKLWESLSELCEDEDFKNNLDLHFYGFTYERFIEELKSYNFNEKVKTYTPIPHKQATKKMSEYRFLFLSLSDTPLSEGRIPLKFFEYIATGRTIIATGKKDTDLSKLIEQLNCGYYINYGEEYKLKDILKSEFNGIERNDPNKNIDHNRFSKEQQAKNMLSYLRRS